MKINRSLPFRIQSFSEVCIVLETSSDVILKYKTTQNRFVYIKLKQTICLSHLCKKVPYLQKTQKMFFHYQGIQELQVQISSPVPTKNQKQFANESFKEKQNSQLLVNNFSISCQHQVNCNIYSSPLVSNNIIYLNGNFLFSQSSKADAPKMKICGLVYPS